jgi:transposase
MQDTIFQVRMVLYPAIIRKYDRDMKLRYNYRLYPTRGQRSAPARAFGCARVVFNDALRIRAEVYEAGLPYITDADLSARLTAAKATPERAWLADVSSVVLQQSLADLNAAYRNFFASVTGRRKGPRIQRPGSSPARIAGRRSGSPRTPGSRSCLVACFACRRLATWKSAGPATCPRPRRA